jgi:predicted RNase H-like HicB family nuclease
MRWFWSLYGVVGRPPNVHTNDHAPTLEEAKAQFESAWKQWLAWATLRED